MFSGLEFFGPKLNLACTTKFDLELLAVVLTGGVHLYFCDVERDCPQADGDEPAGDWATSLDSVQEVLVNKKSNTMAIFILFSTEENLVPFLCCCFVKVLSSHFTGSKDVPSVPVHFVC